MISNIGTYGLSPCGQLNLESHTIIEKSVFSDNSHVLGRLFGFLEFGPHRCDIDDGHLVIGRPIERHVIYLNECRVNRSN